MQVGRGPVVLNVGDDDDDLMDLPPGFRFHPTDEEIITHYLTRKAMDNTFTAFAIAEVDMNRCEPWDLPKKSKMGEKENYFFCQRDRKYPTGMRTNRATESGYWKATGKDKEIYKRKNCLVGMKKTLVFYKGRAPKGEKTNWVMHEYRLEGRFSYYNFPKGAKDEWVVCRVFHKNVVNRTSPLRDLTRVDSFLDHLLDDDPSLPPLMEIPCSSIAAGRATTSSGKSSSDQAILSYFSANIPKLKEQHDDHDQNGSFFMPNYNHAFKNLHQPSSSNCPPMLSIPDDNRNPSYPFSGFKATPDHHYHHQEANSSTISAAIRGISDSGRWYNKVEPFSSNNNSIVSPSQDTGISNDLAPEISSIENNKSYDDHLEGISVDPSLSGLDSLWEFY